MAHHKFRVGQVVGLKPSPAVADPVSARGYKVLRLLPFSGGGRAYCIKTIAEAFERVVEESELVLHSSLLTHPFGGNVVAIPRS